MRKKKNNDPNLDTPAVANQHKHINYLEEEERQWKIDDTGMKTEKDTRHRKEEWEKGIKEGRRKQQE